MRYTSKADGQWLRKQALGPVLASSRRNYALPVPGRGLQGIAHRGGSRVQLKGFGAASTGLGPPVGAGAGAGAAIGASQGASYGAVAGPIGAAIGAVIGTIGGAIAGSINKTDPENANFNQAVAMFAANPSSVYSIRNKYLFFAGLFDLNIHTNIPIYRKFGHMGEAAFAIWLCQTVYAAAQQGRISTSDTALTVMANVVQPAIDAWGYGAMSDPNQACIQAMIVGMILDYTDGNGPANWLSVSGAPVPQFATQIVPFALPVTASPAPSAASSSSVTASATPSPTAASAASSATPVSTLTATSGGVLNTSVGSFTYNTSTISFLLNNNVVGYSGSGASDIVSITTNTYTGEAIATFGNGGTAYWSTSSGWWVPLTAAGTTASVTASTAVVASTTPPAVGATISAALDAVSGQMVGLPAGATYGGLSPSNAWLVVYASGANAGTYTLQSGQLTPYTTGTVTTATSATVSTTPPAIGAPVSYLKDNTTGQMIAIPAGGTYAGLTSTGGWLVAYPGGESAPTGSPAAGTYSCNNGQLTLYSSATTTSTIGSSVAVPTGYTATGQSVLLNGSTYPLYTDTLGNQYVWTGVTMVPYNTGSTASTTSSIGTGGGGGGYYPTDNVSPATANIQPVTTPSAGPDTNTLLLLGAAAVGLYLLLEHGKHDHGR